MTRRPLAVAAQHQIANPPAILELTNYSIAHKVSKAGEKRWEEIHEALVKITLLLVFLHIGGIIMSSIVDKEQLIKAMFTDKKEIDDRSP